jgi:hypothetical protein
MCQTYTVPRRRVATLCPHVGAAARVQVKTASEHKHDTALKQQAMPHPFIARAAVSTRAHQLALYGLQRGLVAAQHRDSSPTSRAMTHMASGRAPAVYALPCAFLPHNTSPLPATACLDTQNLPNRMPRSKQVIAARLLPRPHVHAGVGGGTAHNRDTARDDQLRAVRRQRKHVRAAALRNANTRLR